MTHGDMDDNVHMQNSIYLISKLQDEGKNHSGSCFIRMAVTDGEDQKNSCRNETNNFWLESFFGK